MQLYDWQESDVRKALRERTKGILCGNTMGAGKTIFATNVTTRLSPKQVLIVAPMNTWDAWAYTVKDQTGIDLRRISSISGENQWFHDGQRFIAGAPMWAFINWESVIRLDYAKMCPDVLILDELHRGGAAKAARRRGSNAHMMHTIATNVAKHGGWRIGLSGTWQGNRPENAWSVIRTIWPDHEDASSFWRWAHKHLVIENKIIKVRGKNQEVKVLGDELDVGSIIKTLPRYFRHEELGRCCKFHPMGVQADLPARIAHFVGVDLTASQRAIYESLEKSMFAWIKDNDYPISSEGWPMVNMIRMHQVCLAVPSTELAKRLKTDERTGERVEQDYIAVKYPLGATSSKIDALCDIVADIPPDESIIVYTHSAGIIPVVVSRIQRAFKGMAGSVAAWHGGVDSTERAAIKSDFLAKRVRIIVAQVASIGEGTDGLQHVCHSEIWLSPSSSGLINQQAIKRLHRPGQKHIVQAWYIYARDTLEKAQHEKLAETGLKMKNGLRAKTKKKK